jgi:3-hydroxyacyl-CoA dehydrogenase/enoyl-CoA hydratase/3-hydroxybutyryl-CoA epimerase/3-hydroxyacyl-CoA dehydrogenase/enoyl-CoA hydratase/3-hydroxybutyryl-CoA epimerase/enoyl-CoA isomerase
LLRDEFVGRLDATSGLRHFDHLLAASERELSLQKAIADSPPVGRLGIVGAGMMGTAIAGVGLRRGLSVSLWDADAGAMRAARGRILEQMQGDLTDADAQRILDRQVALAERPVFPGCGLVIESVVEALAAKRELYRQLEPELEPGTLLASNTSTIPIGQLAAGLADPSRFCGVHFFHPVRRRPLVEIIRGPATSQATVSKATALAKRIGKLPIVVDDGPGFLVNRLLLPYLNEALDLLLEGAEIETVENAATRFGMALGPLHLLDEIGLDTAFRAGMVLYQAFGERIAASPLLVSMVKKGRLGRKTGAGFFRYTPTPDARELGPDPQALTLVQQWARRPTFPQRETITARLFLPMLLEATRVLDEGKVANPRDVDLAAILGLGFPAARGGLLYWADRLGLRQVLARLRALESLGPRAEPTPLLLRMARSGGRFYRWSSHGPQPTIFRHPTAPSGLPSRQKRA